MSLTIILGKKDREKYLEGHKYVDYNDGLFNTKCKESWFKDNFVKDILYKIDHIDKIDGKAFHNYVTGDTHAPEKLSTGAKTLILIYYYKGIIFEGRMGSNCTEFLEQMAMDRDIIIATGYMHHFEYKYIKEINYINYGVVSRSTKDLMTKIFPIFYDYEQEH